MAKKILSIVLALVLALSVFTVAASAETLSASAETFADVIAAANQGDTIALTEDIELSAYQEISGKLTLDLAGHTISRANKTCLDLYGTITITDTVGGGAIVGNVWVNGDTTVTNNGAAIQGNVIVDGEYYGTNANFSLKSGSVTGNIVVQGVAKATISGGTVVGVVSAMDGAKTTISGGTVEGQVWAESGSALTISGASVVINGFVVVVGEGTSFTMSKGTINAPHENACVYTRGNSYDAGASLDISGGTFTSDDVCLYLPGDCNTMISGGTFTGATTIGIKSGKTLITGGTFIANGEKADYSSWGNGIIATGDTIEIVAQTGYIGEPLLRIYGGHFSSENANVIIGKYEDGKVFTNSTFVYPSNDETKMSFSPAVNEAFVGYEAYNEDTGVTYGQLSEAVTAASAGDTITLIDDVDVYSNLMASKDLTIDLNGYSFKSANSFVASGSKKTVTVIDSVGTGSINAQKAQAQSGATLVLEGVTVNAQVYALGPAFGAAGVVVVEDGTIVNGDGETAVSSYRGGKVVINPGAEINDDIYVKNKGILEVNGGIFTSEGYCVETNGKESGQVITINGGTFTASGKDSAAIYLPAGTLTIGGGTFKGSDALYIKSGTTVINGGKFYAEGAEAAYKYYDNGFYSTGDTVVVDSCGYPSGKPSLTINNGEFYTRNGEIIGYYVNGNNALDSTAFVYGGQFEKTVPARFWAVQNVFSILNVNGGVATINDETGKILITANSAYVEVFLNTSESGVQAVFDNCEGGANLSRYNQIYARTDGSFTATIGEDSYDVEIVFPHFNVEDLIQVTNATVTVNNDTITLSAIDSSSQIQVAKATTAGTAITFGETIGAAKVSKSGSTLYALGDGAAEITVPNSGTYNVVFDFEEPEFVFSADLLRLQNATAELSGNVITLTPVDASASAALICKLTDGTAVDFWGYEETDAKISKAGSLYANVPTSAKATIDNVDYTVVFNYQVVIVPLVDKLNVTNATAVVDEENSTIVLTPVDASAQINFYPKLSDGAAVTFDNVAGLGKVTSAGTLYAKGYATATATIDGVDYTVTFDYPTSALAGLLRVSGANVEVSGTTITLTATAAQVNFYNKLVDGSPVSYSKSTITSGLGVTATVSKSGTLYAIGNASAVVTIAGVEYTVNFVF